MRDLARTCIMAVVASLLFFAGHAFAQSEPLIPDHINDILLKYKEIQKAEKLQYYFGNVSVSEFRLIENIEYYSIDFSGLMNYGEIQFKEYPDGNGSKSFYIVNTGNSLYFMENFTALTMCVIDSGLSFKNAHETAVDFLSSYDGSTVYSEVKKIGDYTLLLYFGSDHTFVLAVMYNNEINVPVDKSLFRNASYQEMISADMSGEKVFVIGHVEKQYTVYYDSMPIECVEFSSSGKKFRAYFVYASFFEMFTIDKDYTFYGYVLTPEDGYACLSLHYYED